jgi:putative DNA primase/helicase
MIAMARSEPPLPVLAKAFDADPWVLNVTNGLLDLRTARLRPHDRRAFCTKLAPVAYDPAATCPRFEAFLLEVLGGDTDLVAYLQRFAGYCLTGDTSEHVLALLYGTGANGKSTLIEVWRAILGDYATHADFSSFLQQAHPNGGGAPSPDIVRLRGARLVSAIEADPGQRLAENVIKSLTGGDMVTARELYSKAIEFKPAFKLILAANHKPTIRGTDHAIWRRVHLVPFTVTIPPERRDHDLGKKLAEEAPGIFAWMVKGCRDWQREGLKPPASVVAATAAYRAEMDVLGPFLADRCKLVDDADAFVTAKALRGAYEAYCESEGEKPLGPNAFARHLEERGLRRDREAGGARTRLWKGIRLFQEPAAAQSGTPGTARDGSFQEKSVPRVQGGVSQEVPSQLSQLSLDDPRYRR